jgi:hypothetical protein
VAVVAAAAACLALSPPALAGDPLTSIKVNEVESEGLADFIELTNLSGTATDVSGLVLKDNDDTRTLAIAGGTSIPAGGFLAVDTDVPGGFGLSSSDAARVFMPDGVTLIDGHTWTVHAATSFGRCPDGTGAFVTTGAVTKGAAHSCPPALVTQPWPGSQSVTTVDQANVLGADVSGLDYEGSGTSSPGVLWAVDNGNGLLLRLLWDGSQWVRDPANGWSTGKTLSYPGGIGRPDAEGVTLTDAGSAGGVYVSSERDSTNSGVSRPSVLRYDVSGAGTTLTATQEWNLTPDLPVVGPNGGAESVEWVPDGYLVGSGFVDQTTGAAYNPATYANHGSGLFFVGIEANGIVYAYALDQTSSNFTRVATFASGFPTFGALHWESATNQLWVVCDDNCAGRSRVFEVDTQPGATNGSFVAVTDYARPTGMGNFNNEGFTITPDIECVGGSKPVFWADDGNDGGHALRAGTIPCSAPPDGADFNGDGYADLAVGVPDEDVDAVADAGAVNVIYGSSAGLLGTGHLQWTQDSTGIADSAETGDHFGAAVAVGDVNGDGVSDLIVGVPDEDVGAVVDAGAVHVLLGGPGGVDPTDSQLWHQNVAGIADIVEAGDRFGAALAAADHSGDGRADVTIGAPTEDVGSITDAGAVHLLRGAAGGLTATGSQLWHQNSPGIADSAENGDRFGATLAAGDLGGSGQADLAVGAPAENIGAIADAGAVQVLLGGASALTATGSQFWHQNSAGVADVAEPGDEFGDSLAVGNVGGSSIDDLAIGADREDLGAVSDAGVVHLLPGATSGPTATSSQLWHQDVAGIADAAENGDRFGQALAIGNFGGDLRNELAVGVPHEAVGAVADAGAVHVLPGTASFLSATGSQFWHQNVAAIVDVVEAGDMFGASLAASAFKGSATQSGLAVGVPGESVGAVRGAGAANLIYGRASGLAATGNQIWSQNSPGVVDDSETDDHFGAALG